MPNLQMPQLSTLIKTFFFILVVGLLFYDNSADFKPIKTFLSTEPLLFQLGNFKLSVYAILKGILLIIFLIMAADLLIDFVERAVKNMKRVRAANRALIVKVFQVSVYFLAFIIGIEILDVDIKSLALLGGALAIGIGFGLQKITSNFISGLILLFEKSVEEGHSLVEFEDGAFGLVTFMGARYTLVETFDAKEIMVPNEDFISSRVINWTYSNKLARMSVRIGVSYKSDIELAKKLILQAAMKSKKISQVKKPECFLIEYGESSVNFDLFFWVDNVIHDRFAPRDDVLFMIWRSFKENNIQIPFPQRDVHIKEGGARK
jgi:small-conductance mechanosensitive channel